MLNRITWVISAWAAAMLVGACSTLGTANTAATLQAENEGYIAEATGIRLTAEADSTAIAGTAIAAETLVVEVNSINVQLLATVRANQAPTPARIVGAADVNGVQMDMMDEMSAAEAGEYGENLPQFIQTGTSTAVRDADGCIQSPQIEFTPTTPRIYATIVAFNITTGTPVNVEWSLEGSVVWTESFVMQQNAAEICLWFFIDSTIVELTPGRWAVNMYTGDNRSEAPMTFNILEEGAEVTTFGS